MKEHWQEAALRRDRLARRQLFRLAVPEVAIASQGESEEEALADLKEALELHFDPPRATRPLQVRTIEVEVGTA